MHALYFWYFVRRSVACFLLGNFAFSAAQTKCAEFNFLVYLVHQRHAHIDNTIFSWRTLNTLGTVGLCEFGLGVLVGFGGRVFGVFAGWRGSAGGVSGWLVGWPPALIAVKRQVGSGRA